MVRAIPSVAANLVDQGRVIRRPIRCGGVDDRQAVHPVRRPRCGQLRAHFIGIPDQCRAGDPVARGPHGPLDDARVYPLGQRDNGGAALGRGNDGFER